MVDSDVTVYHLFMTFPAASNNLAPAHQEILNTDETLLTQSRETGDLIPNPDRKDALLARGGAPEAKPWAHFVAGGYAP